MSYEIGLAVVMSTITFAFAYLSANTDSEKHFPLQWLFLLLFSMFSFIDVSIFMDLYEGGAETGVFSIVTTSFMILEYIFIILIFYFVIMFILQMKKWFIDRSQRKEQEKNGGMGVR